MRILVNNKIKTLSLIDPTNKSDYTAILLTKFSAFDDYYTELNLPMMDTETFQYWDSFIEVEQDLLNRTHKLLAGLPKMAAHIFKNELDLGVNSNPEVMQLAISHIITCWEGTLDQTDC